MARGWLQPALSAESTEHHISRRLFLGAYDVGQAIAHSPEESIERHRGFAIVTFKITVVQVMEVGTGGQFSFQERSLEAQVTIRRRKCRVLRVEQEVNGMAL